jgi:hypothetical protein
LEGEASFCCEIIVFVVEKRKKDYAKKRKRIAVMRIKLDAAAEVPISCMAGCQVFTGCLILLPY